MSETKSCIKEGDLSTLKVQVENISKCVEKNECRIDKLKVKSEDMNGLSTAISVMSTNLQHMIEHNKEQDIRQDKRDIVEQKRREEQSRITAKQNDTLVNINQNLNELNQGQNSLNKKVENLEERVDHNEEAHMVDFRQIEKDNYTNIFKDYAIPLGVAGGLSMLIIEIIKNFYN